MSLDKAGVVIILAGGGLVPPLGYKITILLEVFGLSLLGGLSLFRGVDLSGVLEGGVDSVKACVKNDFRGFCEGCFYLSSSELKLLYGFLDDIINDGSEVSLDRFRFLRGLVVGILVRRGDW